MIQWHYFLSKVSGHRAAINVEFEHKIYSGIGRGLSFSICLRHALGVLRAVAALDWVSCHQFQVVLHARVILNLLAFFEGALYRACGSHSAWISG